MKAIAIFLLFIGSLLIIQGYYNNKSLCPPQKVVVKYVPRNIYEDQLSPSENLQIFYKGMFDDLFLP